MEIIPIGCNCHPAYWLKKSGMRNVSYPFDWLLMRRPHLGLSYVLNLYANNFDFFLINLVKNERGHPCSLLFPTVEFFHHHNLLSLDNDLVDMEHEKLRKRSIRFIEAVKSPVLFLYCYQLTSITNKREYLNFFFDSIRKFCAFWEKSRLLVYFSHDHIHDCPDNILDVDISQNCSLFIYQRDCKVDKTWGQQPDFFEMMGNS